MNIIPSIDIIAGKCVRLTEGDYGTRKDYASTPAEMAAVFARAGASHLHVVDLDGAKARKIVNWDAIEAILRVPGLEVQIGGGLRTIDEAQRILSLGAARIVVGSLAAKEPQTLTAWAETLGGARICVALDLKDGEIATEGWHDAEKKISVDSVISHAIGLGIRRFLSTDIRRDGKLQGPNFELYRVLGQRFPTAEWIASGGVSSLTDLRALARDGTWGAVVGKAFYEGAIRPEDCWAPRAPREGGA